MVSISACHAEDPGSIPGGGALLLSLSGIRSYGSAGFLPLGHVFSHHNTIRALRRKIQCILRGMAASDKQALMQINNGRERFDLKLLNLNLSDGTVHENCWIGGARVLPPFTGQHACPSPGRRRGNSPRRNLGSVEGLAAEPRVPLQCGRP